MASKTMVLAELGNVVVQAAKIVKEKNTPTQKRTQWLKVLIEASEAYADINDSGPPPKKRR
ncbi:MAG: hypothetical protein L3J39_05350 [Verrucomicrobiales bacterium]|nr:hypothetical protein [Verrucomicrobiales bacterium]